MIAPITAAATTLDRSDGYPRLSALRAAGSSAASEVAPNAALNLLAYVHLRNIHASTGAGRVARQLTEHLALRKDVHLHVLADAGDRARVLPLVPLPWTSFHYHTFSSDTSRQQARWFAFDRPFAESFWPQVQVVFCTAESYVPTRKALLAVTIHDAAYFEQGAHRQDTVFWKQRLKWKLLFYKLSRTADMFHTVSHFSADRLAHFFPSIASRLRVVPNAVTPHFFAPVPVAGRRYLEQAGLADRPFILVPGGLHFRKNADLILAACPALLKRFPDLIVAVVNHSHPVYIERAAALGSNFRLLGFVEDEVLHALYAAASVVWFPSRYEGFGLPVIEAMACGAPVVGSNASSLPEIAGDAALLVDPTQPEAHIDALHNLLTDSRACDQFSRAGRIRASHFTWSSSAKQLKQHFDALL
jgi:glycosyltransferase involved in cell wall biosynthesis